jgi:hypothetical protein
MVSQRPFFQARLYMVPLGTIHSWRS